MWAMLTPWTIRSTEWKTEEIRQNNMAFGIKNEIASAFISPTAPVVVES